MQDLSKPLLIYSNHGFGSYSSYPVIAKYIPNCQTLSTVRREPDSLGKRLMNRSVRTFAASQWYKLTSLQLEWQLVQAIRDKRPSLIHFLWAERDLGYTDYINQFTRIPLCCTFHCCSEDLKQILPYRNRLKSLAAIVIMSEAQRSFFESCGVDSQKIHYIPHGIDTDFFMPSSDQDKSKFVLLSVGSYKRNFPLLREVAIKLRKYPEVCIKVVSSADFYHYFSDLENVEFISNLTDFKLLETYQSSSCLLLTVENATANNALLEGLACGLPIVAEKIGGIPEYVNSDCALLTEVKNPDSIVEAIIKLIESPSLCKSMAQASRQQALDFSWAKVAAMTEALYYSITR